MSNDPPVMGLAEAARACGISVSTLRRRKTMLLAAGANVTDKGWQIPIPALVSLGFMSGTTVAPETAPALALTAPVVSPPDSPGSQALAELSELRQALAAAEARAQVAEAIATERERIIEIQAQALRMLEPGKRDTPVPPAEPVADTVPDTPYAEPKTTPLAPPVRPAKGLIRRLLGIRPSD